MSNSDCRGFVFSFIYLFLFFIFYYYLSPEKWEIGTSQFLGVFKLGNRDSPGKNGTGMWFVLWFMFIFKFSKGFYYSVKRKELHWRLKTYVNYILWF